MTQSENKSPLPRVEENSELEITFSLHLMDGTLVDETEGDEKVHFTIGDGTFVSNLEQMLIGLEKGTTAKLTLAPESAFGQPDPENMQTMTKKDFPEGMQLSEGFVIGFNTPTGEEIPGTVTDIIGDDVIIDFNHPLAGATVIFTAKIEEIF